MLNWAAYEEIKLLIYAFLSLEIVLAMVTNRERYGVQYNSHAFLFQPVFAVLLPVLSLLSYAALAFDLLPFHFLLLPLLTNYFYLVHNRFFKLSKGGSAIGAFTNFLATHLFLLEFQAHVAMGVFERELIVSICQWDFALLMFYAGITKFKTGYWQNEGIQYGLMNPAWGRFPKLFGRLRPAHPFWAAFNKTMTVFEIALGIMLFVPVPEVQTAAVIGTIALFLGIFATIRLNFLAILIILYALLLQQIDLGAGPQEGASLDLPIGIAIFSYLGLLGLVKLYQLYKIFAGRIPPGILGLVFFKVESYFPFNTWSVFDPEFTNYYLRILSHGSQSVEFLVDERAYQSLAEGKWRYRNGTESILLASLFYKKELKVQHKVFAPDLKKYIRSLALPSDLKLVEFQYMKNTGRPEQLYEHAYSVWYATATDSISDNKPML